MAEAVGRGMGGTEWAEGSHNTDMPRFENSLTPRKGKMRSQCRALEERHGAV